MSPSAVKAYLQRRGMARLGDLVNRFDSDPAAVRGVLEFWMRKGRVREIGAAGSACGAGCATCTGGACQTPEAAALYVWVDGQARPRPGLAVRAEASGT